jgi:chromosomal replication initiator protein
MDYQQLWNSALSQVELELSRVNFNTWFKNTRIVDYKEGEVIVGVPNEFVKDWLNQKYHKFILRILRTVHEGVRSVSFSVVRPDSLSRRSQGSIVIQSSSQLPLNDLYVNKDDGLNPRYTFENFVVGSGNELAYAACQAVAAEPGTKYNPLFLYGGAGIGKTHLIQAVGNAILEHRPEARVVYISSEQFVQEFVDALRFKKNTDFAGYYRSADVLIIDDIQFFAGKEKIQEEFFHTFNALHSSKRQIVLTSDRPPKEIEGLEERLRTRFEWGLIADITPPEIETRIAILKAKAERDDIYLPDEVATFLATYIKSNVRELEGVLIKLQAHASLTGAELSLELAKQQLKLVVPEQGSNYTIESIQTAVARHFRLKAADFKSNSKQRSVARPRQIAMYLIRKYTSLGFKEIGHYFGNRDHTTIMHACREIEKKIESEQDVKDAVEAIQNLL